MKKENKYFIGIIAGIAVIIIAVFIINNFRLGSGTRDYVSRDQTQCAATTWICDEGMQQFYDETGCGCEVEKTREYISKNQTQCAATTWICDEGMQQFYDETGCGCEPIEPRKENTTNTQIANPASVNCIEKGGNLSIVDKPEGQVGMCTLSNGTVCEEWEYFRGECP